MIGAILALSLIGHAAAPAAPRPPRAVETYNAGGWRIVRRTDGFTGVVGCTIARGKVAVEGATVTFDVGVVGDDAVYRLDSGPAAAVADDPVLDPIRVSPDVALFNPSGGKVALPASRLTGVHEVSIRAGEGRSPRRFDVSGLDDALRTAAGAGCRVGSRGEAHLRP